jgi:DNA-binding beta-propeller fold protein YncE
MSAGAGIRQYEYVPDWPSYPDGQDVGQVVEIVVDSQDRVYVFHRIDRSPLIFDSEGKYLGSWEKNDHFQDIHGVTIASDDDGEYLIVTDRNRHLVSRTDLEGNVVWTIGTPDEAANAEGYFNLPTDSGVAPNGDIYVADGYGNARVHQFTSSGEHIRSWGEPGVGMGQFHLPHGARIIEHDGEPNVYVCDRENWRIQRFDLEGNYLGKITGMRQPGDIIVDEDGIRYVPELQGRVAILDQDDFIFARIGGERNTEPGNFFAPHSVALDSQGALYVGEVLEGQRVSKFKRVDE